MASLYMVATPIGNLEDMTLRAIRILREVAVIFCEDTRHTKMLLEKFEIETQVMTLHEHSGQGSYQKVSGYLKNGEDVAYVTDAGTPGISDPGGKLVEFVRNEFGTSVQIVPVPGASALTTALSVAGINLERFVFLGFPPVKNKRMSYFRDLVEYEMPVVFYESTFRLLKSLRQLSEIDEGLSVIVCGELTKKFEKFFRGNIVQLLSRLEKENLRGEFVIICYREREEKTWQYEQK
jgi:16S rRNA (cytidine1402-2'-O)-methyltransferase